MFHRLTPYQLALLALFLTLGCRPTQPANGADEIESEQEKSDAAEGRVCLEEADLSKYASPSHFGSVPAELRVSLRVPYAAIDRHIGQLVPTVLAEEERRPADIAGLVSYRVVRQGSRYAVSDGSFLLDMDVAAQIEVCKPLGPFCPTYGRCAPRFRTHVQAPLTLSPDYSLEPPQVSIVTTKDCVLSPVGLDVTPRLNSIAEKQVASIQARVRRSMPKPRRYVEQLWQRLHQVIETPNQSGIGDAEACIRFIPEQLTQGPPKERDRGVEQVLGVKGRVELSCTEPEPQPLPQLEQLEDSHADSTLRVPLRIGPDQIRAELNQKLNRKLAAVRLFGDSKQPLVAAELPSYADCPATSLLFLASASEEQVVLKPLDPNANVGPVVISLKHSVRELRQRLDRASAEITKNLDKQPPAARVDISIEAGQIGAERVLVTPDFLIVVLTSTAKLSAALR